MTPTSWPDVAESLISALSLCFMLWLFYRYQRDNE